jgi:hypothetical protein
VVTYGILVKRDADKRNGSQDECDDHGGEWIVHRRDCKSALPSDATIFQRTSRIDIHGRAARPANRSGSISLPPKMSKNDVKDLLAK